MTWNPYSVLDTGKYGMDKKVAMMGPDPQKSFPPAAKMPDFSERLFPFWKFPEEIDPETFGAKGLMDEGLFPYREYKMLGGMPFQPVQIE